MLARVLARVTTSVGMDAVWRKNFIAFVGLGLPDELMEL